MYSAGEWLKNNISGEKVQIIERIEVWGYTSYKVYNPVLGQIEKIPEHQLSGITSESVYDENYVKYMVTLSKVKNELSQGILSTLNDGVIPLPHQLHVLNKAVSKSQIRYVLADEVGLGKTIEAGLIIKELKARGLVNRILVVCPKGLVSQWEAEMSEKFYERFHVILPSDYETIKKITDSKDVYGQFNQVITPMDSIKPLERRAGWSDEKVEKYNNDRIYSIINSGWDLIIIDEAHRVAGSSSEVSRYKLGHLLSKSSPYLLLLTATPHSGKTEPFLRLLGLLDEEAFPNYKSLVKEQVSPYIIRTEKREAIDNKGNLLFKNRDTNVVEITWDEKHSFQRQLYEEITEYVRKGYNRAVKEKKQYIGFLMVLLQRLVTSSTAAIKDSIEKRLDVLENQQMRIHKLTFEDLVESDLEVNLDEALEMMSLNLKTELADLNGIIETAKQAEYQYIDVKVERLTSILDEIKISDEKVKVIVFTEFVSTQSYLKTYLNSRGYTIVLLNGSMDIDERNRSLSEFKENADILISTDAGGEGLNLQFSNVVINYDLPWNPMKIEQRIGRVDRIGQENDVKIYNFVLSDTVENRIRKVLEEKLSVILEETGIDKMADVLDNEIAEVDFTEVYMRSIKDPKFIDHNASRLEKDLKQQIKFQTNYKDVIREEKDLTENLYQSNGFSIDQALKSMLKNYDDWKGSKRITYDLLNLKDKEVEKHLIQDHEWHSDEPLPVINIHDYPNEPGYFSLWELAINDDEKSTRIIPIFINSNFVFRKLSGKKIWETLLKEYTKLTVSNNEIIDVETLSKVNEITLDQTYGDFEELKDKYLRRIEEEYNRYLYSLRLKMETASKIGIDNIKNSKIRKLNSEKMILKEKYEKQKNIYPVFKPIFMSILE